MNVETKIRSWCPESYQKGGRINIIERLSLFRPRVTDVNEND